ncbi:phage tail assembly protein [Methylobacillus pratensis]
MSGEIFKLKKPIKAHGEEVTELTLREPTGDDIEKFGFPYLVITKANGDTGIEIRTNVVYQYISKLAAIPKESAKQVSPGDLSLLSGMIMGFFGESEPDQETPTEAEASS